MSVAPWLEAVRAHPIAAVAGDRVERREDSLAVEEPLESRVLAGGHERRITVTMRTPGDDVELALGLLVAERVIDGAGAIAAWQRCGTRGNVLKAELAAGVEPRLERIERQFASTASCGLCGKTSLEAVLGGLEAGREPLATPQLDPALLRALPARLRAAQSLFDSTGGLHAVAAFDFAGELLALREDIGRHNAFDKLVGARLSAGHADLGDCLVALSGRAGFELLQKAAVARVPVVVAVGAPSSLAVELAERWGITLVGFLRASSFNVYTHPQRLALAAATPVARA
jgi:FdhD protein